jgi:hypothetical protein
VTALGRLGIAAAVAWAGVACADEPAAPPEGSIVASPAAAALESRYAAFQARPRETRFHRPLHIRSASGSDSVSGEIVALLDTPFAFASTALEDPSHWCEILLLHLDTKACRVTSGANGTLLRVGVVTHYDQPASSAFALVFTHRVAEKSSRYLQVRLDAAAGPMGTTHYRIVLEAMPAAAGGTFMHMSYAYSYGAFARIAMSAYFATFGRGKVGFTEVGVDDAGKPSYIGGMRGVVERNTMRYYLAIEAWLASLSAPPAERVETSLTGWYDRAEHYPRQLHEMERDDYLAMKRAEFALWRSQQG